MNKYDEEYLEATLKEVAELREENLKKDAKIKELAKVERVFYVAEVGRHIDTSEPIYASLNTREDSYSVDKATQWDSEVELEADMARNLSYTPYITRKVKEYKYTEVI